MLSRVKVIKSISFVAFWVECFLILSGGGGGGWR